MLVDDEPLAEFLDRYFLSRNRLRRFLVSRFRNERRSIVLARFSLMIRVVRSSIVVTPVYASKTERRRAGGVPVAAYAVAPGPASGRSGRGEGLEENCAQPQVEPLVHWQSQQVQ